MLNALEKGFMMGLIALVYLSFAKNKTIDEQELKVILESARRNNQEKNITGLLLYRNGFFIQALEGEEADVDSIYNIIKEDSRHTNLLVLYKNKIAERSFADWSMGFEILDDQKLADLPGYSNFMEQPLTYKSLSENPQHVRTLLNMFRTTG